MSFDVVQSDLEAEQHGLLSVQDGFTAVYSDFVIVQNVLNARGRDLRRFVLDFFLCHIPFDRLWVKKCMIIFGGCGFQLYCLSLKYG